MQASIASSEPMGSPPTGSSGIQVIAGVIAEPSPGTPGITRGPTPDSSICDAALRTRKRKASWSLADSSSKNIEKVGTKSRRLDAGNASTGTVSDPS